MIFSRDAAKILVFISILLLLFLSSLYSYLLFHTIIEMFSIVIASAVFVLAWNFRRFYKNSFLTFIGTAFLFCSLIDLLHTMAYKGMGIFPSYDANLATQLWVAARYMQSISLLAAALFLKRRVKMEWLIGGFAVATTLLLLSIFAWNIFPTCYIEGVGLTPFKIYSEYVIDLILFSSILVLWHNRHLLDRKVLQWIILAIGLMMASELAFTFYVSVYGLSNLVGHMFKVIAYFLVYRAVIETEAGKIYADMTQLRATESALRLSELQAQHSLAELRSVYAHTPVGLCFFDTELRYQAINDMLAEINGLPASEHIGKSLHEILPAEIVHPIEQSLHCVLETGQPELNQELSGSPVSAPNQTRQWLVSYHPAFEQGGKMLGVSCVVQDVTEQKRAEQALKESEKRFRSVVESNMIGVVFANPDTGELADANDEYLRIIGRKREQLLAGEINWRVITPPEVLEQEEQTRFRLPPGQRRSPYEKEYLRPDGTRVPVIIGGSYLDDDCHEVVAFVLDNTERKRTEDELVLAHRALEDYAKKLRSSNNELERFAFVASHDLQEPLRKIKMFGNLLQNQISEVFSDGNADKALSSLHRMENAADRMQKMIDGLLELSRVNTREGNFEVVQLKTVVEDVVDDLEARLHATNGQVMVGELYSAEVDVLQIRQLFQNLIGNALKFHKPGIPPIVDISNSITNSSTAPYLTISVKDNGIGFDEQYAEQIFRPFQRLHGRNEYEGSGLGLSICQKIVERHQGKIEAHSQPGAGATFIITLPCEQTS